MSAGSEKGAEFIIRLPLLSTFEATVAPPRRATAATRRRILVVDDNRDAAESMAELLQIRGYTAEVAYDGPAAIERIRTHPPDAVLCDIGLPGMSGYDLARELRKEGRSIRLVAVTGYAHAEDVSAAMEAGFDSHLAKPCDPDDIERLLV